MTASSDQQEPALRAFIGVPLARPLIDSLVRLQSRLKTCGSRARWVRGPNLHLSLRFLGDVPESRVDPLADGIDHALRGHRRIPLEVRGVGLFKRRVGPVIWAGVACTPPLVRLHAAVTEATADIAGREETRAYRPHITLGRGRGSRDAAALADVVERLSDEPIGQLDVEQVVLYRSTLRPDGAVYEALHVAALD